MADATQRLCILRRKEQIVQLHTLMCPGKTSKSTTVVALMEDILGFALNPVKGIGATDKDNIYYLKKSDGICACDPCLNNEDESKCLNPWKRYMRTQIVPMRNMNIGEEDRNAEYDRCHGPSANNAE